MSLTLTIDGNAIGGVRWDLSSWTQNGELGTTGSAEIVIDDPNGALSVTEWKQVTIEESACTQPRLFTGYVHEVRVVRLDHANAVSRRWTLLCVDANGLLYMRLVTGSDGKRPAETWSARKSWLLGSPYLQNAVSDTGKIAAGLDAVNLAATDYRDQSPQQVIEDLVALTGLNNAPLNYFVFWDPSPASGSPRLGLFLNSEDDTGWVSSLALSNVLADINLSAVWPAGDVTLRRAGDAIYSGVVITWPTGRRYVTWASTAATYIARDYETYRPNVGSAAGAQIAADNRLRERSQPDSEITCTVELPATHAGLILPGQGLDVHFSHLPGYTTMTRLRVVSVGWELAGPDRFRLSLRLSRPRTIAAGGGRPPLLPVESTQLGLVQSKSGFFNVGDGTTKPRFDTPPTEGSLLILARYSNGAPTYSGWTELGRVTIPNWWFHAQVVQVFGKIATANEPTYYSSSDDGIIYGWLLAEYRDGTLTVRDSASTYTTSAGTVTVSVSPSTNDPVLVFAAGVVGEVPPVTNVIWSSGLTELSDARINPTDGKLRFATAHRIGRTSSPYAVTVDGSPRHTTASLLVLALEAAVRQPAPGEPVPDTPPLEAPDGSRTTFTTPHAYGAGTLHVLVDGIDATDQVVSSDPATGSFTLSFAPEADEKVTVYYVAG
jgi:hypothetical protein